MTASPQKLTWYEMWFDENYIELYASRDDHDALVQIELIEHTLALPHKQRSHEKLRILDAGCGYGRHVSLLQARGYDVSGVDLSEKLIRYGLAQDKARPLQRGDIRALEETFSPKSFTLILSLFTSLGYFTSQDEHVLALKSMHTVLKTDGWLWIDFLNPPFVQRSLQDRSRQEKLSKFRPSVPSSPLVAASSRTSASGKKFYERRLIENNRVIKYISVENPDAPHEKPREYQESVALYTLDDWCAMTKQAGFKKGFVFGDYEGRPLQPHSPRMILAVQKI